MVETIEEVAARLAAGYEVRVMSAEEVFRGAWPHVVPGGGGWPVGNGTGGIYHAPGVAAEAGDGFWLVECEGGGTYRFFASSSSGPQQAVGEVAIYSGRTPIRATLVLLRTEDVEQLVREHAGMDAASIAEVTERVANVANVVILTGYDWRVVQFGYFAPVEVRAFGLRARLAAGHDARASA